MYLFYGKGLGAKSRPAPLYKVRLNGLSELTIFRSSVTDGGQLRINETKVHFGRML
jgi:hypothetical protein